MSHSVIDPNRLALVIADRLATAVPDGFYVEADGPAVGVKFKGEWLSGTEFGNWITESADADDVRSAVVAALEAIQDGIVEQLRVPWPFVASGRTLPALPGAEYNGRELRFWYRLEPEVDLKFEPVPVEQLVESK
jgi:hypothetical protein